MDFDRYINNLLKDKENDLSILDKANKQIQIID